MLRNTKLLAMAFMSLGLALGYAAATGQLSPLVNAQKGKEVPAAATGPKPGDPAYTQTLDGKYLPNPAHKFGGIINPGAKDSKPYWPPQIVPPKGAPNVLLIMTDDQGYGVSGTFGGVIPTPAMDRVAKAGLRYTHFNSTALCSPTRAALITGRNHHSVGFGIISEQSTGFPGYNSVIGPENATCGEILKQNGYATSWFGKNHNTPSYQYSAAGPFTQWPSGMGFEYFYGFMGGETDQWTPYLFQNTTQITPWVGKPGYNLTTDLADEAIKHMKRLDATAPDKPFFVYYVPGGTHSPHQPTQEWIDKFKGMFDGGWNKLREDVFANQKKLGTIPANAQLTSWPDTLSKWDTLSADEKKLYSREAEVFAAYVAYTDHEIGRVIQQVEDMGKLDNTLIIYISGENGTSTEFNYSGEIAGLPPSNAPSILNRSYTITAEIEVPEGGCEGMLVTLGGRFGGYGLYVLKGNPVFTYNFLDLQRFRWEGKDVLAPGKHSVVFDFKYDGPGFGKGGTGILSVDGKEVATQKMPHSIPFLMSIDETFDVGVDMRTPVDDKDYKVPFRFTGKLTKLNVKLGEEQLTKAEKKIIQDHITSSVD